MPRINELKHYYRQQDIGSALIGYMARANKRQKDMGDVLGISQQAYGYKLMNGSFTYVDLLRIFHELELTDEEILRLMKL